MNFKFKISVLVLLFVASFGGYITETKVKAVTNGSFNFSLPNNGNLVQGCSYSADIRIDTGTNNSNSADIIIDYDPAKIEIFDSLPNESGKQIKPGVAYQAYFGNKIDEGAGRIRLTGASFSSPINGEFLFASINFKSKPNVTSASFLIKFDGAGETNSLDSNIAIDPGSLDALGNVQNGIFTFSPGSCLSDTTAPNVTFINPVNGQLNVPSNQVVNLKITDNLSGVNLTTLEIIVNGQLYTATSPEIQISGTSTDYNITLNQTNDIDPSAPSSILVRVSDFALNSRQSFIIFNNPAISTPAPTPIITTTPEPTTNPTTAPLTPVPTKTPAPTVEPTPTDKIPPVIEFINPVSRETIGDGEEIVIKLTDEGTGINTNSLQILINEKKYTINDSNVRLEGNAGEFIVKIVEPTSFSKVSSSYISVFVSDFAGNSNVSNVIFNIPSAQIIEEIVNKPPPVCNIDDPRPASQPIINAPLVNNVQQAQNAIEKNTPEILKPIVREAGIFGLATIVAALPFIIWFGSTLLSFLTGGLLFPFILGLFASKNKLYGRVVDEMSKKGLNLVTIDVFDAKSNMSIKKVITTFKGRYVLELPKGLYRLEITKSEYSSKSIELELLEDGYVVDVIDIAPLEYKDLAQDIQFTVFKVDPKTISVYFGLSLSFINVLYVRSMVSMIILAVMIMCAMYVTIKFRKKELYISSVV